MRRIKTKFPDDERNRGYPTSRVLLHLSHPIQGGSSKPPFRRPSISFSAFGVRHRSAISPFQPNREGFSEGETLHPSRSIKAPLNPLSASERSKTDKTLQAALVDVPNECIFATTTCDRRP